MHVVYLWNSVMFTYSLFLLLDLCILSSVYVNNDFTAKKYILQDE